MSHFVIFVTGEDNVDFQLEPYCEDTTYVDKDYLEFEIEIKAGEEEQYVKKQLEVLPKDRYPDLVQLAKEGKYHDFIDNYAALEKDDEGNYGYWHNPNAFYDWYTVGGRWKNMLLLKDGSSANVAKKGEIDVHKMIAETAEEAGKRWDKVHKAVKGTINIKKWNTLYDEFIKGKDFKNSEESDAMRKQIATIYDEQPQVKAFKEAMQESWMDSLENYDMPRSKYVEAHKYSSFVPYGILYEGEYISKGEMGWFGVSNDRETDWDKEFMAIWHELDDETMITVVDCHI